MTDEPETTSASEAPPQGALVAARPGPPEAVPARPPTAATTARRATGSRRRRSGGPPDGEGQQPARRGRNGLHLEGRTTTSYPLRDDGRRTISYLRLIVGQAHIPDEATVAVDVDRITIEWGD